MKILFGLLFLCSTLFSCAHADRPVTAKEHLADSMLSAWIQFYRGPLNHLQAVRAGQCPMYPSCSEYSRQALEKHGFALGTIMMFDRLMRCGRDEVHLSPEVIVDGRRRTYDPLAANDFWWCHATEPHTAVPFGLQPQDRGTTAPAMPAGRKTQARP